MRYFLMGVFLGMVLLVLSSCGNNNGFVIIPGPPGAAGVNGTNGAAGLNGTNGLDATPVTLVQLCPGTTTYPSVFVEQALCIGSKLYAVYSANNGFLVELVPGAYGSNAVGSQCNFTVSAGCVVTP